LRDADANGREAARRAQRAKEYQGRSLNALGVLGHSSMVPDFFRACRERGLENTTPSLFSPSKLKVRTCKIGGYVQVSRLQSVVVLTPAGETRRE